jgi:hypothetical protein
LKQTGSGGRQQRANTFLLLHAIRGNLTMAEQIRCTVLNSDLTTRELLRQKPPTARTQ